MTDCLANLGPDAKPCDPSACYDMPDRTIFHALCNCLDWQGLPIPDCNPRTNNFPIQTFGCKNETTGEVRYISAQQCYRLDNPWTVEPCYCCCRGGYALTAVSAPGGSVQVGDLAVGDQVMTAHGSVDTLDWKPANVAFAAVTPPASTHQGMPPLMVHASFGDGQSLIAHPDQLLMLPSGQLKRADQLVPGTDQLVDPKGQPLLLHGVEAGHYLHSLVHFATDASGPADWNGSLDGHLLDLNGAVAGDYVLQLLAPTGQLDAHLADSQATKTAPADQQVAVSAPAPRLTATVPVAAPPPAGFEGLDQPMITIPRSAVTLFTADQEAAFVAAARTRATTDQTNLVRAQYFIKLFSGFFPDVTIQVDWANNRPNVFAYKQMLSRPSVVVPGGFLRLQPILAEAVAAAMAFGIANRQIPADAGSVAHSIYDGFGVILPQALEDSSLSSTTAAAEAQFTALFALVATPAGTDAVTPTPPPAPTPEPTPTPAPTPTATGPSFDCILQIIDAAISGADLPDCAN
ncbi:hypothetical protein [Sphingomonas psychrotolerans]|nr:hypothetical protein [Sphingomonas psychrotolerans]